MKHFIVTAVILIGMTAPLSFLAAPCAQAQQKERGEYDVKAALIFNFIKFTDWPDALSAENTALTICVLGEDPFGSSLAALEGKTVKKGSELQLLHIQSVQDAKQCRVLFICASEKDDLAQTIKAVQSSAILTIGDTPGFDRRGVIVNLYLAKNKVKFMINADAARRAGLQISSRLLKLAETAED